MFFSPAELFDYDHWANLRAIESIATIPAAGAAERENALRLMAHLVAVKHVYVYRCREQVPPLRPFPTDWDAERVARENLAADALWREYFAAATPAELAGDYTFEAFSRPGRRFRVSRRTTMTQVITHGVYHRAQVATAVRRGGGTPASTDFLFWPGGGITEVNSA